MKLAIQSRGTLHWNLTFCLSVCHYGRLSWNLRKGLPWYWQQSIKDYSNNGVFCAHNDHLVPWAEPELVQIAEQYWHHFVGLLKLCWTDRTWKLQSHPQLAGRQEGRTENSDFVSELCRNCCADWTDFGTVDMLGRGYSVLQVDLFPQS